MAIRPIGSATDNWTILGPDGDELPPELSPLPEEAQPASVPPLQPQRSRSPSAVLETEAKEPSLADEIQQIEATQTPSVAITSHAPIGAFSDIAQPKPMTLLERLAACWKRCRQKAD